MYLAVSSATDCAGVSSGGRGRPGEPANSGGSAPTLGGVLGDREEEGEARGEWVLLLWVGVEG